MRKLQQFHSVQQTLDLAEPLRLINCDVLKRI